MTDRVTDVVRVEPEHLERKAEQVRQHIGDCLPTPIAACTLVFVESATAQIAAAANTLKSHVASGNAEADRLATILGAAAEAYREVDETARHALESGIPHRAAPLLVNPALPPAVPAVIFSPALPAMASGDTGGYLDMKQTAGKLESGDPGPMWAYASDARLFADQLRTRSETFSLSGVSWDGTAAESAGDSLQRHREWLSDIADHYERLAAQAGELAQAHLDAESAHPAVEEIQQIEKEMLDAVTASNRLAWRIAQDKYSALVARSDSVLASYSAKVGGKGHLNVQTPPSGAAPIKPIVTNGDPRVRPEASGRKAVKPAPAVQPRIPITHRGRRVSEASPTMRPATASSDPDGASAQSQMPSIGGAAPSAGNAAAGRRGGSSPKDSSMSPNHMFPTAPSPKPAGSGSDSAGVSEGPARASGPLSPTVGAETVASAPVEKVSRPGATGDVPAVATGGAMAPIAQGSGQASGGEKRRDPRLTPEDELYTEDRAWTEAVIGNRRRHQVRSGTESK